ncbi:hypothetical protein CPter291_3953 [Collimonas pratensis]|uniref:Uncharacterized protein n=1 Tax=Collimonas pratensis TaxID=279113 RepID=A0A127R2F3_9BURK|nr:hypothetical protein CPter91_3945 [Collimonas pratensis]AMP16187.1 hypothetical protein CPter291_3953 [Collimonas pratensis]
MYYEMLKLLIKLYDSLQTTAADYRLPAIPAITPKLNVKP